MNNVPKKLKNKWTTEDILGLKRVCLRADEGDCAGKMTKEHAIIYAGSQVQDEWAIIDLCSFHHAVNEFQDSGKMNKEKHVWLALKRATDEQLRRISKAVDYIHMRNVLSKKYEIHN